MAAFPPRAALARVTSTTGSQTRKALDASSAPSPIYAADVHIKEQPAETEGETSPRLAMRGAREEAHAYHVRTRRSGGSNSKEASS